MTHACRHEYLPWDPGIHFFNPWYPIFESPTWKISITTWQNIFDTEMFIQNLTFGFFYQITHFWKRPWVNIYWSSVNIWLLRSYICVHVRDTPDVFHPFLALFQSLETSVTTKKCVFCVHTRSLVRRLLSQTSVWRRMSVVTVSNGLIRCLGRGSSPRVSESVKMGPCGPKFVHDHRPWWWSILLCDSGFYGSFFYPMYGYVTCYKCAEREWSKMYNFKFRSSNRIFITAVCRHQKIHFLSP